ncbi:unnamed protein product, partial [marine sediment metagenome]
MTISYNFWTQYGHAGIRQREVFDKSNTYFSRTRLGQG